MSRADIQRRWLEKLKADPVRLAAYRAKTRAASLRRYHETVKRDAVKLASKRKAGREYQARKRRGLGKPMRTAMPHAEHLRKRREWQREWRERNREHIRQYQREYVAKNIERVRFLDRTKYYPRRLALKKVHYHRNPAPVKARVARWQNANRDRVRDYAVARSFGCKLAEIPPDFLALNRAHLNLRRELRN